jgi:hypothetical protein
MAINPDQNDRTPLVEKTGGKEANFVVYTQNTGREASKKTVSCGNLVV